MKSLNSDLVDSHSTGDENGNWNTKKIAICALFSCLAIATSYISIPIFPLAPFLKYDPSGVICLICALIYGTSAGCIVTAIPWIIRAFTNPVGALMSFVVMVPTILVASLIFKGNKSNSKLVLSLVISAFVAVIIAILANLIITPLYSGMSFETVKDMIVPILLPFNALKFALNGILAYLLYHPLRKIL